MTFAIIKGAVVPGMNNKDVIERGKALVRNGATGRAAAVELYGEYFADSNVQPSTRDRRLKHLARKFKTP